MVKVTAKYEGEKHCELTHGPSQATIVTDAPKDNNGKGEAFSPTDLVAAATGSCILTVMAIMAEKDGVDLKGAYTTVEKEMFLNPRRIGKLTINVFMPKHIEDTYRQKLENTAMTCPVKKSLHPEMQLPIQFHYSL
ncbi:OsmC family protein [Bdellovibrio sp. HCB337]|uniref:OsmC family protein n=1 Tax=Bdellovibrio sp. HCB337 TaxID=3394358 RepID=UPI0039A663B1